MDGGGFVRREGLDPGSDILGLAEEGALEGLLPQCSGAPAGWETVSRTSVGPKPL